MSILRSLFQPKLAANKIQDIATILSERSPQVVIPNTNFKSQESTLSADVKKFESRFRELKENEGKIDVQKQDQFIMDLKQLAKELHESYPDFYIKSASDILLARQLEPSLKQVSAMLAPIAQLEQEKEVATLKVNLLLALSNLSIWILDDKENAKKYCNEVFTLTTIFKLNPPETATTLMCLGDTEHLLGPGHYAKAKDYYAEALKIRMNFYGEKHADVASSYHQLSNALERLNEVEDLVNFRMKALNIRLAIYGEKHVSIVTSYRKLGNAYQLCGDIDASLKYLSDALRISLEINKSEHPETAAIYSSLGDCYSTQRDSKNAIENYKKACAIYEDFFHDAHPILAVLYNSLGNAHRQNGNNRKAIKYYGLSLSFYKTLEYHEKLSEVNLSLTTAAAECHKQVNTYKQDGHTQKAIKCYGSLLSAYQQLGDKKKFDEVNQILISAAAAYHKQGSFYQQRAKKQQATLYYKCSLSAYQQLGNEGKIKEIGVTLVRLGEKPVTIPDSEVDTGEFDNIFIKHADTTLPALEFKDSSVHELKQQDKDSSQDTTKGIFALLQDAKSISEQLRDKSSIEGTMSSSSSQALAAHNSRVKYYTRLVPRSVAVSHANKSSDASSLSSSQERQKKR
jgi:tetratricopeptide (TPR) repeat protein